jgi:hypothetical protein
MATVDGCVADVSDEGHGLLSGFLGASAPLDTGAGVPTAKFKMRGWHVGLATWRTWVSYGTADTTPPVGLGPCVGVTVVASWE